ncbi:hypothetical protein MARSALSMR5_04099 (plasmid) [Marinobacter salarius]|uniref:Uncharacterized protein n=1 Tax=Marinobacter salarius TaxID=1420917 RepID=A0A1W6KFL5_9GAMM|nr:hypothetical protein MARSALSMR5_04099 [Marinobacter salarius]
MRAIEPTEAYVAVDKDGFVDGACFTQSEDSDRWVSEMKKAGCSVQIRGRAEAKRILFTHIGKQMAVLEAWVEEDPDGVLQWTSEPPL